MLQNFIDDCPRELFLPVSFTSEEFSFAFGSQSPGYYSGQLPDDKSSLVCYLPNLTRRYVVSFDLQFYGFISSASLFHLRSFAISGVADNSLTVGDTIVNDSPNISLPIPFVSVEYLNSTATDGNTARVHLRGKVTVPPVEFVDGQVRYFAIGIAGFLSGSMPFYDGSIRVHDDDILMFNPRM